MLVASALGTWEAVIAAIAMVLGYIAVAALWWFMVGRPSRQERRATRHAASGEGASKVRREDP